MLIAQTSDVDIGSSLHLIIRFGGTRNWFSEVNNHYDMFEELSHFIIALKNRINFTRFWPLTHFKTVIGNCFDGLVIIKFADTGPYNTWNTKNIVGKTMFCKSSLNLKLVTPSIRANRQKWQKDPGDEKLVVKVGISCFTKNIIHLILRYCFKM